MRETFRSRTDGGPEFRACKVADYDTHRDHKHVGDAVLKAAGNEHRYRQDHDHRFIHQATTGIAHPYGETNHQVSEDTQAHGLHKSMVHFVVGGLQNV